MTTVTDAVEPRPVRSVCRCCTAGCGVVAEVRGTEVVAVRGDPARPNSRGCLCPKGHELPSSSTRPDRLDRPTMRGRAASWDDALDDIAAGLARIVAEHGPDAWGWFPGNGSPADHLGGSTLLRLGAQLGSSRSRSAATIDIAPSYQMAEFVDPSVSRGVVTITQGWADASVAHLVSLVDGVDPLTGQPAMSALDVSLTRARPSRPDRVQERTP